MRTALVYGFWGQNIGNAFFNVGGQGLLQDLGLEVSLVQDQPGYRTFHPQHTGNPPHHANLLAAVDTDLIVLQGPLLTVDFLNLWGPTLRAYKDRGVAIGLLGAGLFKYTALEVSAARTALQEIMPDFVVTRDPDTYDALADLGLQRTYSGVDSAFFCPRYAQTVSLRSDPYVCFGFDRLLEPRLVPTTAGGFRWSEETWTAQFPHWSQRLVRAGKGAAYLAHLLDKRKMPNSFAGHAIVRPEHRSNPFVGWKVFKRPNAMVSDEPYSYLALYAQSSGTFSDRVHACVATLAYGGDAMLFSHSPRGSLFKAVGAEDIRSGPVRLNMDFLNQRLDDQTAWLRRTVGGLRHR